MKLSENAQSLLKENSTLQEKAYQALMDICRQNDNEFGIQSYICIDLDLGFVGIRPCNLKGLYINKQNGVLMAEAVDIDTADEKDIAVPIGQSIEILEILADATISEESVFIKEHPDMNASFIDEELENAWKLLSEVNINEDDEIVQDFLYWESGTDRQYIWNWFDKKHSKGVGYLNEIA